MAEQLLAAPHAIDGWVIDGVSGAAPTLTSRAPQVAVDLLTRIRGAVEPDNSRRERLDADLTTALFTLARYDQVEALARPMLAATSDPEVAGRMTWTLAFALNRLARHEAALKVADGALRDLALPEGWRARARAIRAMALVGCGRPDEADAAAAQAEGRVRGPAAELRSASPCKPSRSSEAAMETIGWRWRAIERALAVIGQEPATADLRLILLGNRASALESMGRKAEVEQAISDALLHAEQAGNSPLLASIRLHAADHCCVTGDGTTHSPNWLLPDELPQPPTTRLWRHGLGALIASHRDDRRPCGSTYMPYGT